MTLKNVLLTNAISSGITGVVLATAPSVFTRLFKIEDNSPFILVGIFLIAFALFVFAAAISKNIPIGCIRFIITMDITWVIASAIAVMILFSTISITGSVMILAVAGWVGMMAYLQHKNLERI